VTALWIPHKEVVEKESDGEFDAEEEVTTGHRNKEFSRPHQVPDMLKHLLSSFYSLKYLLKIEQFKVP
jgi:hypothetical protein